MDDHTEQRILEKAEYVRESLVILADIRDTTSFDTYRDDRRQQDIVEREFQTSIEACLNIGSMILRTDGVTVPQRNADIFRTLAERGILTERIGRRMAEAVGFRNILAHRYGTDIDNRDVFNFLQHDLGLFREFLAEIKGYLDTPSTDS